MLPSRPATLLGTILLAQGIAAQQFDLHVYGVEDGLPSATVNRITEDSTGYLWLDTDGGLCRFDGFTFRAWHKEDGPPPPELRAIIDPGTHAFGLPGPGTRDDAGTTFSCRLDTRSDGAWIGTVDGVLITRNGRRISTANGLGNNEVLCLYQDRSDAIWIGTAFGGVTKYTSGAFTHFTERDGLRSRTVSALFRAPDSSLYIGTYGGGVTHFHGQRTRTIGREEGLADANVRCLGGTTAEVLIGTSNKGLFSWNGTKCTRSTGPAWLANARIHRIRTAPDSSIWLATDHGALMRAVHGTFIPVGTQEMDVHDIAFSSDSVFLGTAQGVFMVPLTNNTVLWRPVQGVQPYEVSCLQRDGQGNLWIGTEGDGLIRFDGARSDRFSREDGLGSERIEQVLLDANDNIWVGTPRGFDLLELDLDQERVLNTSHFSAEEGFIGTEAFRSACMLDADGSVWFGTVRGATRYDAAAAARGIRDPTTHIVGLDLFYQPMDLSALGVPVDANGLPIGMRLQSDRNQITFHWQGISLAYPERVRYQFILEGHDPDWSPITADRRFTYSNLPPGTFTFKVIARNAQGVWNRTPATFGFTIAPPFYRTWSFLIAATIAALLALWAFIRLRDRRSRRERARLEKMVAERTRELEEEKHRSDRLLLNILPETTAAELKERGSTEARSYSKCTVLFSDFQGFTSLSEKIGATGIVTELDRFFRAFDRITDTFGTEKIKTIGDAYMCAAGVPNPSATHALDAVLMALEMIDAVDRINTERALEGQAPWPIRIGIHSGPLIAGVVGEKKFAYDIWGDTVNLASRMESNGAAGQVNASGSTCALVMDFCECRPRGPIKVKGKGEVQMYFVTRLKPEFSADSTGHKPNEALLALRARLKSD